MRWNIPHAQILHPSGPKMVTRATDGRLSDPILEARALVRDFRVGRGLLTRAARLRAVRGVSMRLYRNETVAVVGESGCGKTTFARIALGLLAPSAGEVRIAGRPVGAMQRAEIAR